jgi:hypothetical protein
MIVFFTQTDLSKSLRMKYIAPPEITVAANIFKVWTANLALTISPILLLIRSKRIIASIIVLAAKAAASAQTSKVEPFN